MMHKYSYRFFTYTLLFLATLTLAAPVNTLAGTTYRVNMSDAGIGGISTAINPSISAHGRFVVFQSFAANLVSGDTNGTTDIFVHDRITGQTTRVSVTSSGAQSNANSFSPFISADGRFVVFSSYATNLVSGDTNASADAFVHDRITGQTTRVSVTSAGTQATLDSFGESISADGRFVVIKSYATNLVLGDTNVQADLFVHDRATGQITRVSVASSGAQSNASSTDASISADGRFVVFQSFATTLVSGDTNGTTDIFVHDRATGQTTRVSVASNGAQATGYNNKPSISADGRFVAFESAATNLVSGDTNGTGDIFVHDRSTAQTTRVSVTSAGQQANLYSYGPTTISADGRYVAFRSIATNLVASDTNGTYDVFVHDRTTGATTRVSVDETGLVEGNGTSRNPSISADGRFVAFQSQASNLVARDFNRTDDIFVHDRDGQLCRGRVPTIMGTNGADNIVGTNGDDVIQALNGNDVIDGLGGNDIICGNGGNDDIKSASGNNILMGDWGDDIMTGGSGSDRLESWSGINDLIGGAGFDTLYSGSGADVSSGGAGNDYIRSGAGDDILNGGDGQDVLNGGDGNDTLNGDAGKDILHGGLGVDICDGGLGRDSAVGADCETVLNIP